jgi:uroporphyrinogen-III synthase
VQVEVTKSNYPMNKMPYALITRPTSDAETTYSELEEIGVASFIEPMLHVNYLEPKIKINTEKIIITSGHAARALSNIAKDIKIIAVGKHTEQVAMELGFTDIEHADGDSKALVDFIKAKYSPPNDSFIYAAAPITAGNLQEGLQKCGFNIRKIEVYEALPAEKLSDECITKLKQQAFDLIVFYSPRTAEVFASLITKHALEQTLITTRAFCLSKNVAEPIKKLQFAKINVAKKPENQYLLELIYKYAFM